MSPLHNLTPPATRPGTPPPNSSRERFFGRYREPEETSTDEGASETLQHATSIADRAIVSWKIYEADRPEPSRRFLLITGGLLIAIIGYALFSDSPIMAITFILIGLMGYLLIYHEPSLLNCHVTEEGIVVNHELFPFETAKTFWVFENENFPPYISLETRTFISPHVHIPLDGVDPEEMRDLLARFLPEEKHELTPVDILSRMLHI